MASEVIDKFCRLYESLDKHNLDQLGLVYSDDINFVDALHNLHGLDQLNDYYANLLYCRFSIEQVIEDQGQASVIWTMEYAHPKINKANAIVVNGCSYLKYDEKIYYHRDFLDMGQMLYEHLPLLGAVIRTVKKRVVS